MELVLVVLVVTVLVCLHVLCLVGIIRNEITYRVRMRWIDDIYQRQLQGDDSLRWDNLPKYMDMLVDFKLWKYKPLGEYIKNKA